MGLLGLQVIMDLMQKKIESSLVSGSWADKVNQYAGGLNGKVPR